MGLFWFSVFELDMVNTLQAIRQKHQLWKMPTTKTPLNFTHMRS